jgi:hypothetical protein
MKKVWRKKMFSLKSMTKLEDLTVIQYINLYILHFSILIHLKYGIHEQKIHEYYMLVL